MASMPILRRAGAAAGAGPAPDGSLGGAGWLAEGTAVPVAEGGPPDIRLLVRDVRRRETIGVTLVQCRAVAQTATCPLATVRPATRESPAP